MRSIPLSRGLSANISEADAPLVAGSKWTATKGGNTFYAYRTVTTSSGRRASESMHRVIAGARPGQVVDHINGDGLDNRRENLRVCSHAQNIRNQAVQKRRKTSRFKGVWSRRGRWHVMIQHGGEKIQLGTFDDEERAARQYDRMARVLFGPFAKTNEAMGLFEMEPRHGWQKEGRRRPQVLSGSAAPCLDRRGRAEADRSPAPEAR